VSLAWRNPVKYRQVTTRSGHVFDVPEYIVRLETVETPRWQLRYGEWTDFQDSFAGPAGTQTALDAAICEMQFRIDALGK
jgi:hypothetical protein